jgi:hypothetical protein
MVLQEEKTILVQQPAGEPVKRLRHIAIVFWTEGRFICQGLYRRLKGRIVKSPHKMPHLVQRIQSREQAQYASYQS